MDEVEDVWDREEGMEEDRQGTGGGVMGQPQHYQGQTYPQDGYGQYGYYQQAAPLGYGQGYGYPQQAPPQWGQQAFQTQPHHQGATMTSSTFSRPNVAASTFTPRAAPSQDYYGNHEPARGGVLNFRPSEGASPAPKAAAKAPQPAVKASTAAGGNRVLTIGGSSSASPKPEKTESTTPSASAPPSAEKKQPPSDIVKPKAAEETSTPRGVDAVADDLSKAADEETLKDLYGGYESMTLMKEHVNIVFIGHVDAGKSTMGGNILFLTGMVDKRTMEKYEKEAKDVGRESWYLSWALDSTTQERAKGKTVEVGRGYFETDKRRYTILDAPGHKNYVPSMIGGAAQADVAVLVISARRGEFETGFEKGGQTREHAMLVKTAGVNKLIIVINKMDDPTVAWDKERYDECIGKLKPFVKGLGFNLKTDVEFMPVSGFTGANIKDPLTKAVCPWHSGPSLLQYLDTMTIVDRKMNAPFMMPISEKYKDKGTIVVGKIEAGRVRKGDTLILMPNRSSVEVSAIFNEQEEEINQAICGDNIRLKLRGVAEEDVLVGFVLSDKRKPVHVVTHFEAQLAILEHRSIICGGYSAVMHVHTSVEEVRLEELLHYFDKKTGRKSKKAPQFAKKGMKIIAVVVTDSPICLETFTDFPSMGRFTLRDEGRTIAIGRVTRLLEREDIPTAETVNANADARAADAAAAHSEQVNGS